MSSLEFVSCVKNEDDRCVFQLKVGSYIKLFFGEKEKKTAAYEREYFIGRYLASRLQGVVNTTDGGRNIDADSRTSAKGVQGLKCAKLNKTNTKVPIPYIITQKAGKKDLSTWLEDQKDKEIPIEVIRSFAFQLTWIVAKLNSKGIQHNDITEQNIRVDEIKPGGPDVQLIYQLDESKDTFKLVLKPGHLRVTLFDFGASLVVTSPTSASEPPDPKRVWLSPTDLALQQNNPPEKFWLQKERKDIEADAYMVGLVIMSMAAHTRWSGWKFRQFNGAHLHNLPVYKTEDVSLFTAAFGLQPDDSKETWIAKCANLRFLSPEADDEFFRKMRGRTQSMYISLWFLGEMLDSKFKPTNADMKTFYNTDAFKQRQDPLAGLADVLKTSGCYTFLQRIMEFDPDKRMQSGVHGHKYCLTSALFDAYFQSCYAGIKDLSQFTGLTVDTNHFIEPLPFQKVPDVTELNAAELKWKAGSSAVPDEPAPSPAVVVTPVPQPAAPQPAVQVLPPQAEPGIPTLPQPVVQLPPPPSVLLTPSPTTTTSQQSPAVVSGPGTTVVGPTAGGAVSPPPSASSSGQPTATMQPESSVSVPGVGPTASGSTPDTGVSPSATTLQPTAVIPTTNGGGGPTAGGSTPSTAAPSQPTLNPGTASLPATALQPAEVSPTAASGGIPAQSTSVTLVLEPAWSTNAEFLQFVKLFLSKTTTDKDTTTSDESAFIKIKNNTIALGFQKSVNFIINAAQARQRSGLYEILKSLNITQGTWESMPVTPIAESKVTNQMFPLLIVDRGTFGFRNLALNASLLALGLYAVLNDVDIAAVDKTRTDLVQLAIEGDTYWDITKIAALIKPYITAIESASPTAAAPSNTPAAFTTQTPAPKSPAALPVVGETNVLSTPDIPAAEYKIATYLNSLYNEYFTTSAQATRDKTEIPGIQEEMDKVNTIIATLPVGIRQLMSKMITTSGVGNVCERDDQGIIKRISSVYRHIGVQKDGAKWYYSATDASTYPQKADTTYAYLAGVYLGGTKKVIGWTIELSLVIHYLICYAAIKAIHYARESKSITMEDQKLLNNDKIKELWTFGKSVFEKEFNNALHTDEKQVKAAYAAYKAVIEPYVTTINLVITNYGQVTLLQMKDRLEIIERLPEYLLDTASFDLVAIENELVTPLRKVAAGISVTNNDMKRLCEHLHLIDAKLVLPLSENQAENFDIQRRYFHALSSAADLFMSSNGNDSERINDVMLAWPLRQIQATLYGTGRTLTI
jgi:serine/threonine protein kinase